MDTKGILAVASTHTECMKQKKEENTTGHYEHPLLWHHSMKHVIRTWKKKKKHQGSKTHFVLWTMPQRPYTQNMACFYLMRPTYLPVSRRQKFIFLQHFIFSTFCAMPKPGQAHYIKHRLLKQQHFGKWRDDTTWQPVGVRCWHEQPHKLVAGTRSQP